MKLKNIKNLVIVLLIGLMTTVVATTLDPGTQEDPLVTKGYVDNKFAEINTEFAFEPIKVDKGQKVIGVMGTEMILRSGEAKAISVTSGGVENGLQDMTDGVDLKGNQDVPLNHLIIIPRDDGRGISLSTDAYIMIRGNYSIK